MPKIILQHFECPNWFYDLYQQEVGTECPECGNIIKETKQILKEKNPRRVAAQHKALLEQHKRDLKFFIIVTVIPAIGIVACVIFHASWWLYAITIVVLLNGAGSLVGRLMDIVDRKEKYELWAEDPRKKGEQD